MTKENGGDDYIYDVMTAKKENQGCGKIISESSLSKGYICGDKYLCYNCQKKKENHSQQAKNDKLSQGGNHGDTPSVDNTHKTHLDKICKECIICKKKINNLYPKNDYVVKIETSHSLDKMWDDMETYYCCSRSCWKKFEKQLKTAELYEKKIDEIISKLGEIRGKDNGLISIKFGNDFTTNSIEMLKDKIREEMKQ